jgi:AraC family transcriptional regulator
MAIKFSRCGFQGEISSAPDRIIGLSDAVYLRGIGFVEYDYYGPGAATQSIAGLLIGACEGEPDCVLSLNGSAHTKEIRDAFILRGPGQGGNGSWSRGHRGRLLSIAPNVLERIFCKPLSQIRIDPVFCNLRERMHVLHLLASLSDEHSGKRPIDPLFVESVALAAIRASGVTPLEKVRKSPTLTATQIGILRDVIAENLANPLTLREMAMAVDLSESYFVRAFKGSFGVTPYRYVLRARVALAQTLIQTGDLSLAEVAAPAGFPDANRMGRTFRQITGRSPTGVTRRRGRSD